MGLRNAQTTRGRQKAGQYTGGWRGLSLVKTANYTLKQGDSGKTIYANAADLVITLPSTAKGLIFRVQLTAAGLSVGTGLSISPAALDKIMGNGFTSADNKDAILTGATDREGDLIELEGDGVLGWYFRGVLGAWARET